MPLPVDAIARPTPFGDRPRLRDVRDNPFDVVREYARVFPPPLAAAEIYRLQAELSRFDIVRENIIRHRKQARRRRARILYRTVGRLTLSLVRLAARGIAARVVAMMRRRTLRLAFRNGHTETADRRNAVPGVPGFGTSSIIQLATLRSRRNLPKWRRRA